MIARTGIRSHSKLVTTKSVTRSFPAAINCFRPNVFLASKRTMITSHAVMIKDHGEPDAVLFTQEYQIDDDNLADDSVIVKVLAAPINPSDINQIQGVYPSQPQKTTKYGTDFPAFVCGNEGLFEVVKVGSGVKGFSAGDWVLPSRVCGGTWRTFAEFKNDQLFKIPTPKQSEERGKKGLTVNQASTLLVNPLSAYLMLTHFVQFEKGKDWVIQNGGNSAVGQYVSQMARNMGVNCLSVIRDRPDLEETKQQLKEAGATEVIIEEDNNSREFSATVKQWVKGTGGSIKLGLNCVGGKSSTAVARKLDQNGIMLTYGGMSFQPVIIPTSLHIFKNITSAGFWCTRIVEGDTQLKQDIVQKIVSWYENGELVDAKSVENKFEGGDLSSFYKEAISAKNGKHIVTF